MVNAKILLVSNDPETSQLWAHSLGQKRLDVSVVSSSQVASVRWIKATFALVIVDVNTAQIVKPITFRLLLAKVTAWLRRPLLVLAESG
jgi:DNA-binding response OmpR family regulator